MEPVVESAGLIAEWRLLNPTRRINSRAGRLVAKHWQTIVRVAEALFERQALTADDLAELVRCVRG